MIPRKYKWYLEWERIRKDKPEPPAWVKAIAPLFIKHLTTKLPKIPKLQAKR